MKNFDQLLENPEFKAEFERLMEAADQDNWLVHYGYITQEEEDKFADDAIEILETADNDWDDMDFVRVIKQLAKLHNS